jgi:hypothetical protein
VQILQQIKQNHSTLDVSPRKVSRSNNRRRAAPSAHQEATIEEEQHHQPIIDQTERPNSSSASSVRPEKPKKGAKHSLILTPVSILNPKDDWT